VADIVEAPGHAGPGASGEDVQAPKLNTPRDTNCNRLPQLRCEFCGKPFPKTSKRPQRCCSPGCRKALSREMARTAPKEGRNGQSVQASRYALKKPSASVGCKVTSGDRHPSRFDLPLDILGRGLGWSNGSRLDRATWERILWCEVAPPPPARGGRK
jgi:hypothetical protein